MVIEHTVVIQGADMQMQQMLWYLIVEMGHASNEHTYNNTTTHQTTYKKVSLHSALRCDHSHPHHNVLDVPIDVLLHARGASGNPASQGAELKGIWLVPTSVALVLKLIDVLCYNYDVPATILHPNHTHNSQKTH